MKRRRRPRCSDGTAESGSRVAGGEGLPRFAHACGLGYPVREAGVEMIGVRVPRARACRRRRRPRGGVGHRAPVAVRHLHSRAGLPARDGPPASASLEDLTAPGVLGRWGVRARSEPGTDGAVAVQHGRLPDGGEEWSGCADSNCGPRAPKARALTRLSYTPMGSIVAGRACKVQAFAWVRRAPGARSR